MRQVNPVLMNQLMADHAIAKQLGSPLLQCQGMLVPRDPVFQATRLLIQSCPRPMVTNNDPAEIAYAGGLDSFVPGVPKTKYEGSISVIETENGQAALFAEYILANGGNIPCDYYGVIGVPITFMTKHNPEQFSIVGVLNSGSANKYDFAKAVLNGKQLYARILIQRKQVNTNEN